MNFESLVAIKPKAVNSAKYGCVVSSRIRFARNIADTTFPGWATQQERKEAYVVMTEALKGLDITEASYKTELVELDAVEKQVLVEQHLMSRPFAARSEGCGVLVNRDKTISLMLNEEDHFRLQAIFPGLNLKKAYKHLSEVDDVISERLTYAFDETMGFLTSCPTNVGTGMRASVMLHLPALTLKGQMKPVINAMTRLGYAVRGFYGEGTDCLGHLYQISNQSTLGESELEIIQRLERNVKQVVTAEMNARNKMLAHDAVFLNDKLGRAYGVLKHAHVISSQETLDLLSLIRLGADLQVFEPEVKKLCEELVTKSQPAHLQLHAGEKVGVGERDKIRAKIVTSHLQSLIPPDTI